MNKPESTGLDPVDFLRMNLFRMVQRWRNGPPQKDRLLDGQTVQHSVIALCVLDRIPRWRLLYNEFNNGIFLIEVQDFDRPVAELLMEFSRLPFLSRKERKACEYRVLRNFLLTRYV